MKTKYLFVFFLALSSLLAYGFTDDDPLKELLSKIERFRTERPQEKVHLHLDKPYYSIGDTIWFKAYVVNSEKNQLSAFSKILHVDLINEKDSIKKSLALPLVSGLAWGDFTLADSLREGNYRIRAYTNWMRNFGEEFYFDRTISIGNALVNTVITNTSYAFSKIGNNQKVEAVIGYTDAEGNPVANKEVNYEVVLDFRSIAKGKGITDAKGNLSLSFINNQPFLLKSGKIHTSLKLGEKQYVAKSIPVKSTSDAVDVQFFPEGGQLVDSLRSRVAFKAVNAAGLGEDVNGYIVDKDNNRIAEFQSQHTGIGSFVMTPFTGNRYNAVVRFKDGSEKSIEMPPSSAEGYVLSVSNIDTANLGIRIMSSRSHLNDEITLVAQTNGVVHYVSKTRLDKQAVNAVIPKSRFPTGILQLTLFTASYRPVAERLAFIDHNDQLKIDLTTDKPSYGNRQKVRMQVDVSDILKKSVAGSFSVAVTDMTKVPVNDKSESTILSNLLLSSDLKGYIENPNYYFERPDQERIKELDNLMMSQGWRRVEWKDIQSDLLPGLVFQPEQNLSIRGRVVTSLGAPVPGGKVTLFATSGSGLVLDTITDEKGNFAFENLVYADSARFLVQARNSKDRKNVEIELEMLPAQVVTKNKNAPDIEVNINNSIAAYLTARQNDFVQMRKSGLLKRAIVLQEVKVTEKKALVKNSTNLNGAGNADQVITSEQLQNCNNLLICLQSRIPGIIMRGNALYSMRSPGYPMQVVIDGMTADPSFLASINPVDVENVEVLKSIGFTTIYGGNGAGGVLVITTKRGQQNLAYGRYAPGAVNYVPKGYYFAREYYSPNYDNPQGNLNLPDLRTTIYWNPNLVPAADGKIGFDFFTADSPGTYRAVVEGVGINGKLGRKAITFTVK